jgi:hypothetical protein
MSITLTQLRTESRQRADMTHSTFVTDSELNTYINRSIAELHDILIQAYGAEYIVKDVEFTTANKAEFYPLPTVITDNDFYKLKGVDAKLSGNVLTTLDPFNFNERNRNQTSGVQSFLGVVAVRYRLVGGNIRFSPVPDDGTTVKVWYVPVAAKLVDETDTLDDLNQFSEYIIVDAAIKMMQKEESDVSVLLLQKRDLKRRIEEVANNRDAGTGDSVSDVTLQLDDIYLRGNS